MKSNPLFAFTLLTLCSLAACKPNQPPTPFGDLKAAAAELLEKTKSLSTDLDEMLVTIELRVLRDKQAGVRSTETVFLWLLQADIEDRRIRCNAIGSHLWVFTESKEDWPAWMTAAFVGGFNNTLEEGQFGLEKDFAFGKEEEWIDLVETANGIELAKRARDLERRWIALKKDRLDFANRATDVLPHI